MKNKIPVKAIIAPDKKSVTLCEMDEHGNTYRSARYASGREYQVVCQKCHKGNAFISSDHKVLCNNCFELMATEQEEREFWSRYEDRTATSVVICVQSFLRLDSPLRGWDHIHRLSVQDWRGELTYSNEHTFCTVKSRAENSEEKTEEKDEECKELEYFEPVRPEVYHPSEDEIEVLNDMSRERDDNFVMVELDRDKIEQMKSSLKSFLKILESI